MQAVDLQSIQRELDELANVLRFVPPYVDGVEQDILIQCKRIAALMPEDLDLADCPYQTRRYLKALRMTLGDPSVLSASEIESFAKLLDASQPPTPQVSKNPTRQRNTDRKKRPGLKPPDAQTVKRERELAEDWRRARESGCGITKAQFAADNDMSEKLFHALVDRVRKRAERSEQ